jgi:hypothetical protein
MVFAVYMPPHEPGPGIAFDSTSWSSRSVIFFAAHWPTASKTETTSSWRFCQQPGMIVPP